MWNECVHWMITVFVFDYLYYLCLTEYDHVFVEISRDTKNQKVCHFLIVSLVLSAASNEIILHVITRRVSVGN